MHKIQCKYRDILFITDNNRAFGRHITKNGDAKYILRDSDHVEISCVGTDRIINLTSHWSGYGAGFRKVFRVAPDPDRVDSVNVVFLGFDSTSRNGFLRDMPRTLKVLKDFGAVIMNGYNILGDATPATMFPLLTGRTELELPDRRRGFSGAYVDDFPFVFKRLWGDGYRTAYFEDSPEIGTFQMRFNGFCNPPADHYLRHFFLLANEVDRESAGPYSDQ
ncbi:unnamed protein product [Plutella xylostella]|uniref:(diamondback moth) hypothetical protein n=1 Tax=Plutella xylostella TaxID=51655 RepID=A0A8S4ELL9_PLUXY|nr:unnamed protein product [Plutella xylostella]